MQGAWSYLKLAGKPLPHSAKARLYSYLLIGRRYLPASAVRWYHGYSGTTGLVSYPKCGRTWLRVMVGKVLADKYGFQALSPLDWRGLSQAAVGIPELFVDHEDNPHRKAPCELEHKKGKFNRSRIVLLVRDPRDVIVSLYHHEAYRNATYKNDVSSFIRRERGGIDSLIAYYNIWARNHQVPEAFMLMHYEDLHADTRGELRRILRFIGLEEVDDSLIERAVAYGSFANMRQMETQNRWPEETLRVLSSDRPQALKTREGRVNGYTRYLNAADIGYLNARIAQRLSPYYRYVHEVTEPADRIRHSFELAMN